MPGRAGYPLGQDARVAGPQIAGEQAIAPARGQEGDWHEERRPPWAQPRDHVPDDRLGDALDIIVGRIRNVAVVAESERRALDLADILLAPREVAEVEVAVMLAAVDEVGAIDLVAVAAGDLEHVAAPATPVPDRVVAEVDSVEELLDRCRIFTVPV